MKKCEVCRTNIPPEFQNLLCGQCYDKQVAENNIKEAEEKESRKKMGLEPEPPKEENIEESTKTSSDPTQADSSDKTAIKEGSHGIRDPDYRENPEMEDKPQWEANIVQFANSNLLLWTPTRMMYTYIKNYLMRIVLEHPQYPKFIWKPTVVDVGCGSGVGANIISQEADMVWGIDKNKTSIRFATEAFERQKNGIYYSSQLTFDHIDILEDTREYLKFDYVICIEIIEHIYDYKKFLYTIIKKFRKKTKEGETQFFISTPNRNHKTIAKDHPKNIYHVREWTAEEFFDVLSEYFEKVQLMSAKGEPTERSTEHTPILAQCSVPKI